MGRHDRPRQGVRHRSLLRRLHEPPRRVRRDDRAVVGRSDDRQALRVGFSRHHRRRHGADGARSCSTCSASSGSRPLRADHSAACRHSNGRSCTPIRSTRSSRSPAPTRSSRRAIAWNAIARNAIMADPDWQGGHYYGTARRPDGGMGVARMVGHITYLSAQGLGDKFGQAAAVRRRHSLHADGAGVRGRELPAASGRHVREAVRREHVPLYVAGADVFRSRAAVRQRIAGARATQRIGAYAADRVQLGLAVSAVGVGGACRRPSRPSGRTSSCISSKRLTGTTASCWKRTGRRR